MRIRVACAASLLTLLALAPVSCHGASAPVAPLARTCSIAPPAPKDWRLRADGTAFRDALGRVVVLRGVNAGGRSKWAPFVPFDFAPGGFDAALASYMDRAAAWGLNVLRLPFIWSAVEPTQGTDDAAFLARYDALIDAAWARGIRVVVDFHQDVYAENFCGDGFPAWTLPAPLPAPHHDCPAWGAAYFTAPVQAAFDAFWAPGSKVQEAYVQLWDRMVARYKDRPGVVGFEPINEPNAGSAEPGQFEATTLADFYSRMIARIHASAPSSLVFFETIGFDGGFATTKLVRPKGDGIVFAPHYYPLGALEADVISTGLGNWADLGKAWNVPVFVGEFGHNDRDSVEAFDDLTWHYDALDARLSSGTQWEYSVAVEDWNDEGLSLAKPDGTEWKLANALVRPYARATAGRDVAMRYDVATRTFTLSYVPDAAGVTEISMPPRVGSGGLDVELAGGCYDASHPGVVLVQSDSGAAKVEMRVTLR